MKTIKISQFKARLSSFLRRVLSGKRFTISARNQPIAIANEASSEDFEAKDGVGSFLKFIQKICNHDNFDKPQRSLELLKQQRTRR